MICDRGLREDFTENGLRCGVIGCDIPEGDFSDAVAQGADQSGINFLRVWKVGEEYRKTRLLSELRARQGSGKGRCSAVERARNRRESATEPV